MTYLLSFKFIQEDASSALKQFSLRSSFFPASSLLIIGIAVVLLLWSYSKGALKQLISKCGGIAVGLLIASTLVMITKPLLLSLNTLMFNISIFFIALMGIWYGFEARKVVYFNMGIALFVILIITRYFDLFWGLLDRSVFFIGGGLLLLVGSVLLEKKRRMAVLNSLVPDQYAMPPFTAIFVITARRIPF